MDRRQTCIARFRNDMAYLLSVVAALPLEPRQQPLSRHTWRDGTPMTVASLFAYTYQGETHYRGHAHELTKTTW